MTNFRTAIAIQVPSLFLLYWYHANEVFVWKLINIVIKRKQQDESKISSPWKVTMIGKCHQYAANIHSIPSKKYLSIALEHARLYYACVYVLIQHCRKKKQQTLIIFSNFHHAWFVRTRCLSVVRWQSTDELCFVRHTEMRSVYHFILISEKKHCVLYYIWMFAYYNTFR